MTKLLWNLWDDLENFDLGNSNARPGVYLDKKALYLVIWLGTGLKNRVVKRLLFYIYPPGRPHYMISSGELFFRSDLILTRTIQVFSTRISECGLHHKSC